MERQGARQAIVFTSVQTRRFERKHSAASYRVMKLKLSAFCRPMPVAAILCSDLEQLRHSDAQLEKKESQQAESEGEKKELQQATLEAQIEKKELGQCELEADSEKKNSGNASEQAELEARIEKKSSEFGSG